MTQEFLNEEIRQFKDCTREQQHILLDAILAGNASLYWTNYHNQQWVEQGKTLTIEAIALTGIYRTKPIKRLAIPWEHIKPEYKFAAMSKDDRVNLFTHKPTISTCGDAWVYPGSIMTAFLLNLDLEGISWRDSLVERPAEVKS